MAPQLRIMGLLSQNYQNPLLLGALIAQDPIFGAYILIVFPYFSMIHVVGYHQTQSHLDCMNEISLNLFSWRTGINYHHLQNLSLYLEL